MARGFKTGGRKKGSKNKRTLLLEATTRKSLDNATEILGAEAFDGDAHALLILTYKNTSLPIELRIDAAKAAIRFEKPALSSQAVKMNAPQTSVKDLTDEELEAIIQWCRSDPKIMPS